ncbi:MAG: hypothetical protein WCV69_01760 [Patescibacteria group bacterium]|jgi:hypothetical protein
MSGYKKLILVIIGILLATSVILVSRPAQGFGFGGPVWVMYDWPRYQEWLWTRAKTAVEAAQGSIVTQIINRTLSTFANKLAYDLANNLATSGPGRTPLFERESFTKSLQTARDAALGEFIGQISQNSFEDLGFNLCDPSLSVKLSLTLSLIDSKAPPRPTCDWTKVKREWSKFGDNFTADLIKVQLDTRGGSQGLEDFFANGFSLEQTDLGVFAKLSQSAEQKESEAIEAKKELTRKCQGYLDNTTPITEEIKTSCMAILQLQGVTFNVVAETDTSKVTDSALKKEVGVIGTIMKTAGNIFVNTFTSKLMNRWIKDGMWSVLGGKKATNPSLRSSLLAQLRGGASVDKTSGGGLFVDFQKIQPETLEAYNILDEFAICPEEVDFRKPDNCVISADFLEALASRTTLQEAIDNGLISGSLPLIGSDETLRNANKECYKDALCYSNLVKLRKANIIPTGWEMAALRSPMTSPTTLQQAMDCFEENTGKCKIKPAVGETNNPYYHLIDPYWILKSPPALCNAYVYSPVLESPDTSNRQQYCADIKTCLREDDQGNCLAGEYGYCTKSENIWRFTGDECVDGDIYSGCLTFQNDNLPVASYLEQSLDYCSADQAGCKRYSQEKNNDGDWVLQDIATDTNDLFLNNKSATCPADYAGCSEYMVMAVDTGANLVANGDFETDTNNDNLPDNFVNVGAHPTTFIPNNLVDGEGVSGSKALLANINEDYFFIDQISPGRFSVRPNTNYIVSIAVRRVPGAENPGYARIMIDDCKDANDNYGGIFSPDGSIPATRITNDSAGNLFDEANIMVPASELSTTEYAVISGTFNTGSSVKCMIGFGSYDANNVSFLPSYFDNFKIEAVSEPRAASAYSNYGNDLKIYMNGSRFMCTAQEIGCQGYTPSNGDPMIPAVISQNDLCPNECVGYASFAEEPDNFDLIENPTADFNYYNFIPSTAKSCSATVAGCEEFTNVDAVAAGGEGKEYYTYLRQCVSVDQGEDYITWEGTDVAGYQIRAWKALPSNVPTVLPTGTVYAPCTNILSGSNACNDNGVGVTVAACGTETASLLDDPSVNANCRQFFNPAGNSFYRLQDRVIFASDDCHDYRRTLNPNVVYRATPSLSNKCSAAQNGCRAYYGNTANNVRNIFTDDFERAAYTPWQGLMGTVLDLSSESLERNGHSLKLDRTNGVAQVAVGAIQNNKQYKLSWWMKPSVSLGQVAWNLSVTNSSGGEVLFPISMGTDASLQNIPANNWQYYTVTQYFDQLDPTAYNLNSAKIVFSSGRNAANENGSVFLDNIILKEVAGNIYVIRNSWQTPVSCDTPYVGYHLGCQTYTDTNNNKYNLKSFQNLCRVEAIGCMAVVDTHNSDNPFTETFHNNPTDPSQITVPADSITYLVPDNRKYCPAVYQGCQALGLPDRTISSYLPTVYKINDPDQYVSSLCFSDDLYCEEYSSDKGAYYFKDPRTETCTYQSNVTVGNNIITGWFKTANLKDPLPLGCLDTDNAYDAADFALGENVASCPADKNLCTTFYDPTDPIGCGVGTCSDCATLAATECIGITDELNCSGAGGTFTLNPNSAECQPYYYYNNEKIDKASCNGQVNENNGCVLFKEANNWNSDHTMVNLNYDAVQSYNLNVSKGTAVSPVTCDPTDTTLDPPCNLDSNVLLKVRKDRQCSEWLACRSSSVVWDNDNNRYKVVCADIGTCTEFDSKNNVTKCGEWATPTIQALTVDNYQNRSTGADNHMQFGDEEYTGYSIPNMLPIATLGVTNAGSATAPLPQLVYNGSGCSGEGTDCTAVIAGDLFNGVCRGSRCLLNPVVDTNKALGVETRGYAQSDSPFPGSISPDSGRLDRLQSYAGANMCEVDQVEPITASPNGCEATYIKVTYGAGGTVRYYPKNFPSPGGICSSGNTDTNVDCVDSAGFAQNNLCDTYNTDGTSRSDGTCDKKVKAETIFNWSGICLEYDANSKVVNDTGGTNYCNQWYPADQISGTNSLYDNYREAGYYEPGGREALFCSVTEPYILQESRIYCGRRGGTDPRNCNLLIRIPAGSKILANSIAGNSSLISYNYLRPEKMNHYDSSPPSTPPYTFEYIEKRDLSVGVSYEGAKFSVEDFVLTPGNDLSKMPVVDKSVLRNLFDTGTNKIDLFYYDENIDRFGDGDEDARIYIGDTTSDPTTGCVSSVTAEPDRPDDASNACTSTSDTCLNGPYHQVYQGFCNPGSWNYYVKAELADVVSGTGPICGAPEAPAKGRACLMTSDPYRALEASCGSDSVPGCAFVNCVEDISSPYLCVDYGSIIYGSDTWSADGTTMRDVNSVTGCLSNILSVEPISIASATGGLKIRQGVDPDDTLYNGLIAQALGNVTRVEDGLDTWLVDESSIDGCLQSDIFTGVTAVSNPTPFPDKSCDVPCDADSAFYTAEMSGRTCTGMACYQQCKIVVDLDSEGDKSWVRTDIWWRNETGSGNSGRNNYPTPNTWLSYYYKSGFIQNSNVNYASITGENNKFTHFGSALGYLGKDVVNVRVPVNASTFSPLAAATFYAPGTGNLSTDLTAAHTQLAYMFYRVYNMQWNNTNSVYEPYTVDNIYVGAAATRGQNTLAGPDFVPRILTVCGSDVCRDANKVVINGVTVNEAQGGSIEAKQSFFASLKFYYYAHPDHMPVKSIEVDWGDGSAITTIPGKYKNNIPDCNVDAPLPGQILTTKQGFGGTERACREAYKTFYHDYQLGGQGDLCDGDISTPMNEPYIDNASCYKPTVRVQDNWGNWSAWTSFAGWIVVLQ